MTIFMGTILAAVGIGTFAGLAKMNVAESIIITGMICDAIIVVCVVVSMMYFEYKLWEKK